MSRASRPEEPSWYAFDVPTASFVAGYRGHVTWADLQRLPPVLRDYTKLLRKGLKKAVAEPFRATVTIGGSAPGASEASELSVVVGTRIGTVSDTKPVEISAFQIRQALQMIRRRWISFDVFEEAGLQLEDTLTGGLVASGPKASARLLFDRPDAKRAAVRATANEPGAFDGHENGGIEQATRPVFMSI
jgi:hypothetical protein